MKKFFLFTAASLLAIVTSCTSDQASWAVSTSGADGSTVKVIDLLNGEVLASADNGEDLKGEADKNALLAVQIDGDDWQTLFFNDGKPVSVNFEDQTLKGSKLNEKLNAADLEINRVNEEINAEFDKFRQMSREEVEEHMEEIQALQQKSEDCYRKMLEENSDNIIPAAFMNNLSQILSEEELNAAFESGAPYAEHPYARKIKKQVDDYNARWAAIEAAKQEAVGKKFTDLEEPDVNGKMHKLSEYLGKGKWVYVDFWASWCGPCRAEMPNVVAAYKKYHPKGLEIVGLSFDNDKDAWVKAIKELEMPWIHLSDLKGWQTVASDTYNIKSIPASLLVDPEGVIVARDLRGSALGEKLAEIFGE